MVTSIASNPILRNINTDQNRFDKANAAIASGRKPFAPDINRITTYDRGATTDTSDLTGITNPDDPNNTNPINVSYNQVLPTSTTTEEGGEVDIAAAFTERTTAQTLFSLGIEAAKKDNEQKRRRIDILA